MKVVIGSIITTMLAAASPAISQDAPPLSEQAKQTIALVDKAAALTDKNGKAAFTEFRKRDSEWFHSTTYLYAYDLEGNVLLNPAFPMREGTNVTGQKDAKGKLFHNEIIKTAETKGSGWVEFVSQAGTNLALAEMGLCEKSDDRWSSRLSSLRLPSAMRLG